MDRKRYLGIDMLKAFCAFLIVCIHCPFPGVFGQYFVALTRIAVPIFFMITGYFYMDIQKGQKEVKQIIKIIKLFVVANIIYFSWSLLYQKLLGKSLKSYIYLLLSKNNLSKFIIFNVNPLRNHLWYLGAILYVLLIVYWVNKRGITKYLYCLIPVLLAVDLCLGKYSLVLFNREFSYIYVRNFLFVGLPYFCIGYILRRFNRKNNRKILFFLAVLFSITTILERYILVKLNLNAVRDHYISTTLLAIVVFKFFALMNEDKENKIKLCFAGIGKKYSTWIYIIHPIFIDVTFYLIKKTALIDIYKCFAPIIIYILSICCIICALKIKKIVQRA